MSNLQVLQAMHDKLNERIDKQQKFYNECSTTLGRDKVSDATSRWYMSNCLKVIANATQERDALNEAIDLMTKFEEYQRKWSFLASGKGSDEEFDVTFTWVEAPKDV